MSLSAETTSTPEVHPLSCPWSLHYYAPASVTPHFVGIIASIEEFWCMATHIAAPSSLPDGACYEWRCQMIPHPLHVQSGGTHRALNMQDGDVAATLMTALGEAVPTRSRIVYVAPQCLIDIPWGITSPPITLRAFSSPSAERITVGSRIPPLLVWLQDGYGRGVVHPGRFRTVTAILARPHGGHLIGTTTLQLDEKGTASFEDLSVTRIGETMILFTCPDQMNATDHSAALSAHVPPFLVTPMPEFLRLQGVPPAEVPRPTAQNPKAALGVIKPLDINSAAKKSSRSKGVPPAGKHMTVVGGHSDSTISYPPQPIQTASGKLTYVNGRPCFTPS